MASSAEVAKRREEAGKLWIRGAAPADIAKSLDVSVRTIHADIESIREQLQHERLEDLEQKRDRSLAVFREVQKQAWILFFRIEDKSLNKSGALNTVRDCEREIARLEGTAGPLIDQSTTVNILQLAEWQKVSAILLAALMPYPEARVAAADALMQIEEGNSDGRA